MGSIVAGERIMDSKEQIKWISTLRGLAVLLVFISHLYLINGSDIGFVIGRIGVVLFFLIAGYLARISRNKRTSKQYIINRLFRMYPEYWIILFLTCILSILLVDDNNLSVGTILCNMTLFNEFMGIDGITGGTWMLPILICFYLIIGICGINFFMSDESGGGYSDRTIITMVLLSALSIIIGLIRFFTKLPFPTAYFLLLSIGFLGVFVDRKNFFQLTFIFEVGLIVSAPFSYGIKAVYYIIAYNIGIFGFLWARKSGNLSLSFFNKLGDLGFTFFLGSSIPIIIFNYFIDVNSSIFNIIIFGYILRFVCTYILAVLITRFIEKPILSFSKKIERTCV